jgi:hypothetical protein
VGEGEYTGVVEVRVPGLEGSGVHGPTLPSPPAATGYRAARRVSGQQGRCVQ